MNRRDRPATDGPLPQGVVRVLGGIRRGVAWLITFVVTIYLLALTLAYAFVLPFAAFAWLLGWGSLCG